MNNKSTLIINDKIEIVDPKFAVTQEQQKNGLMNVHDLPSAMIFIYPKSNERFFWMKNTPQPLDVVFCNDNKIIAIFAGKPYSEKLFGPKDQESNMVIELPIGFCMKNNISLGDSIKVRYSAEDLENIAKTK